MRCLVTYDVSEPHHALVKAQCIRAGFHDSVEMLDGSRRELPNTTLIVEAFNTADAVKKFKQQVSLIVPHVGLMSSYSPVIIKKVIGVECVECYAEDGFYRNVS
jgi:hypothetical protein